VWLEIGWTLVPLALVMVMFVWGADIFVEMRTMPADALEVDVVAKQWMWKLQHEEGRPELNALHVPLGQPVRLRMISEDVIHSFYVPAFRVKQDVLPGYYTEMWFEPTRVGAYHLFCAEYCGTEHSLMRGTVTVMEPDAYAQWIAAESRTTPAAAGKALFEQFRCASCHKGAGAGAGPPLHGVYGSRVPLKDGRAVVADEQYLRDSILNPAKDVVAGYEPVMPAFRTLLTEGEVLQLIAYLKTLAVSE
jgi:cytochrome c oxidase subunit 2